MTALAVTPVAWTDAKRWLWLLSIVTLTLPVASINIAFATGSALGWWSGWLFVFGVIPLLDWLLGEDDSNPPEAAVPALEAQRYYRYAVYLAVLAQYVGFFVAVGV